MVSAKSNWSQLKVKVSKTGSSSSSSHVRTKKKTRFSINEAVNNLKSADVASSSIDNIASLVTSSNSKTFFSKQLVDKYVGLDCEMVGIGLNGKQSALARCCLVNFNGEIIFDSFVRPPGFVTDFRTQWSGVKKKDLRADKAITLAECQAEVARMIKDKILVGHALQNDLSVLMLKHSYKYIRDTARYEPFMKPHPKKENKFRPRKLKDLAKDFLGVEIQTGDEGHDPSEDARTAVMLYKSRMQEWERHLKDGEKTAKMNMISKSKLNNNKNSNNNVARKKESKKARPEGTGMFGAEMPQLKSVKNVDSERKKSRDK